MKLYSIYIYIYTGGEKYAMILPIAIDTIGASLIYSYQTNHTTTIVNPLLLRHGENCN